MPEFVSNSFSLLQEQSGIFIAVSVVFGLLVGSFLNVVIYRLPRMMQMEWERNCQELQGQEVTEDASYNLVVPRSACPQCAQGVTVVKPGTTPASQIAGASGAGKKAMP